MAINYGTKFTDTTNANWQVTKWSKDLTIARERNLVLPKLVTMEDVDECEALKIPAASNLADPGDLDDQGDLSDVTPSTEGVKTLDLDQKKGYKLNFPDFLSLTTKYRLKDIYTKKAEYGIRKVMEVKVANHWNSADNSIGDNTSFITYPLILRAAKILNQSDVPSDDRNLSVSPGDYEALLQEGILVEAQSVAWSREDSPILTGRIKMIDGIGIVWSNAIVSAGGDRKNMLMHKSAIRFAKLRDVRVEKLARTHAADSYLITAFYGSVVERTDHMVTLISKP